MEKEWLKELPEELQQDPALQSFEDVASLAKSYKETKSLVGKKGLLLPGENAKDEEWNPVFEALGRPKEAKEYEIPAVKLPNGMKLDMTEIEEFKQTAHAMGMTKKQFQKAIGYRIDKLVKEQTALMEQQKKAQAEAETVLRQKYGSKYEEKIQGAQKLLNAFGAENAEAIVSKYGSDPDLIEFLGRVVDEMSEGTLEKIGHAKGGALTPEEALAEINAIMSDKTNPHHAGYFNSSLVKQHEAAMKRLDFLYTQAYPGKKKI